MNNNGKINLWIIIFLVLLGLGMITSGTILMLNDNNNDNKNNNVADEDNSKNNVDIWKNYDEIEKYDFASLKATNLDDIEVNLTKVSFESQNGSYGTLDFSKSSFVPNYFSIQGFEGQTYMTLDDNFDIESWSGNYSSSDASIFDDILKENQKIKFYTADKKNAYANLVLQMGESYWVIGVNMESKTIDEAVNIFKELIPLAVEYDETAVTIQELSAQTVKKIKFNIPNITLSNVQVRGTGLTYAEKNDKISITSFESSFYSSYFLILDEYVSLSLTNSYNLDEDVKVKEIEVKGIKTRIYHKVVDNYDNYKVGFVYEDKEYLFNLFPVNSYETYNEQKIVDFLNKIIEE